MHSLDAFAQEKLHSLEARDLRRRLSETDRLAPPLAWRGGRRLISFCCNDYLGLSHHPTVKRAAAAALDAFGAGAGASRLVTGNHTLYAGLEARLAALKGSEAACVFGSGYLANLGIVPALVGPGDLILADELSHACLLAGGSLSGARLIRFRHNALDHVAELLDRERGAHRHCLILTDGVFSMDGDLAPLDALAPVAGEAGAWLCVDDAHGLGVVGPGGRGTAASFGLGPVEVPALVGTLGKAFGVFGAFVAGARDLAEALVQSARPYIYTTALPPALAEAARTALKLVIREPWRRDRVAALAQRFNRGACELGLGTYNVATPVQPLLVGAERDALALSDVLKREGFWVPAIRPPTVPEGSARLRVTLSAAHTETQVDRLLDALERHAPGINRGARAANKEELI